MDVREKLVELLDIIIQPGQKTLGDIADYLITNGVTVQEWISVKDRLPEPFVYVLVHMPNEKPSLTVREGFITRDGIWHSALYDREPDEVTHWMPLPEMPKGE